MSRPYLHLRIDDLERIYRESGGDRVVLTDLAVELGYRKMPRALILRKRVEQELEIGSPAPLFDDGEPSNEPMTPPERRGDDTGFGGEEEPRQRSGKTGFARDSEGSSTAADEPPPESPDVEGRDLGEPETPEFSSSARAERREPLVEPPEVDALLATWTTLEVLEPQPLPTTGEISALRRQLIRSDESSEPWTEPRYRRRGRERGVFWFVYLGQLSLAEAMRSLLDKFPDESPEKPPRTRGAAPLAAVVLDEEGRLASAKTFLASFGWGYGKVLAGQLRFLAEFPRAERGVCEEIEKRLVRMDEDGEIEPVSRVDLDRTIRWLISTLGLPEDQVEPAPVFVRVPVWGRFFEAPEPELLNSFFVEDLARVRDAAREGDVGRAFGSFVRGVPARDRRDVVREPEVLDHALAPEWIPLSRWPLRGRHPLSTMQQAAVNHVARELPEAGLVGINGPPGTGKTTLLRDVIAKVVLDRACAMVDFDDPQEAWTHRARMKAGQAFLHLYDIHQSLLGHEIVVSSSNNKAVENVSREIPSIDAVADDFEPPLRYFQSVADAVFATPGETEEETGEQRAWGLAAAVLGNAGNKYRFAQTFFWHEQWGLRKYLKGIVDGWDPEMIPVDKDEEADRPAEVLFAEDAPRDRAHALKRWRDAKARFLRTMERAQRWRETLQGFRRDLHRRAATEDELTRAVLELQRLRTHGVQLSKAAAAGRSRLERARAHSKALVSDRDAIQALKPGFFASLFRTRSYRVWLERMTAKVLDLEEARASEGAAETASAGADQELERYSTVLQEREGQRLRLATLCTEIRENLARAREVLGERQADRRFWSLDDDERQKLSPWLADAFQAERDALFAASFEVHRAFIDASAAKLLHNLGAAMELLRGRKLSEKQEPARQSVWASLFLVVPVLSSTFASVSKMFGPLGREALGWLLIDEAGQAVPQAAVGAIWRSRRVIAVGDPMQLQPIVTLSRRLVDAISSEYGIDPESWTADRSSVQSLADRASWFGTWLSSGVGDVWVGCPLRVHRRCQDPMFRISNQIAYDGLMVRCTPDGPSAIGDVLGPSCWISVASEAAGHWSPEEGEMVVLLMTRLLARDEGVPDIFFITPFRHVMLELRRKLQRVLHERLGRESWRWVEENVGTIHVFQGKEAEAVVLVCGAPSEQAAGARRWAGSRPNLLNVAVSRAKSRLYVVGDRERWREAGVFRVLHSSLPQGPAPPWKTTVREEARAGRPNRM